MDPRFRGTIWIGRNGYLLIQYQFYSLVLSLKGGQTCSKTSYVTYAINKALKRGIFYPNSWTIVIFSYPNSSKGAINDSR